MNTIDAIAKRRNALAGRLAVEIAETMERDRQTNHHTVIMALCDCLVQALFCVPNKNQIVDLVCRELKQRTK